LNFAIIYDNLFDFLFIFYISAHSKVFACPTVQSKDALQLFVSEKVLDEFEKYVYTSTLENAKQDQLVAFQLLEMAHFYNMDGLEGTMRKKLLAAFRRGLVDIDVSLLVYSFTKKVGVGFGFVKLGERAFSIIKS